MQYFGGKLSAAQLHMAGWMGSVRRSLQGALEVVWGTDEERQEKEEEEEVVDGGGRFQRAMSPLRSFARRSRRSLHRFSLRSRRTLQRRTPESRSPQVDRRHTNVQDGNTDPLVGGALNKQEVISDKQSESDEAPELSSEDPGSSDFQIEPELPPFPETVTPLLDTSAQRSRVDLGRRHSRSRPTRSFRAGLDQTERRDWRARDTTDERESKLPQSDSEDEQPNSKAASSPSTQKVPVFPGVSPASLIAQLKKRTPGGWGGGGEEADARRAAEEKERRDEDTASSPSQLSRSPRTAAHLAGAARVLPPIGGNDGGAVASPAWLKELKSKKRLSQYDSEA